MESIEHIYNDVLTSLHFSITGHPQFEDELYAFYDKLAESTLFKQNHGIRFLIGSICELKDHNSWEVAPYKQLYFKSYFDIDKISLLSFYFYTVRRLSEILLDGKHINASKTIAESFNRQVNVRVNLSAYSKPFCKFDDRISLFEVRIPYEIFTAQARDEVPELRDKLHDAVRNVDPSKKVKKYEGKKRYYSFEDVKEDEIYRSLFDSLFDEGEVKKAYQELSTALNKRFAKIIRNSAGVKNKELAVACIGIGFLCLYFNASIEYFTGIAKVHQTGFAQFEYRNLGGIVVGYQKKQPLSKSERAIFGLITDKLTSVIAGQIVVNELDEQQLHKKGFDILSRFDDDYLRPLTHTDTPGAVLAGKINEAVSSFLHGDLKKILTGKTFQEISEYLEELKSAADKKKFIEDNAEELKRAFRFMPSRWAEQLSKEFRVELGDGIRHTHDYVYCDMEYLNALIRSSITNSRRHNSERRDLRITIDLTMRKTGGEPASYLYEAAVIEISLSDNGDGCNLDEMPSNSTTYGKLRDWKHVVNAFGEVELRSGGKRVCFNPERKPSELADAPSSSGFVTAVKIHKSNNE